MGISDKETEVVTVRQRLVRQPSQRLKRRSLPFQYSLRTLVQRDALSRIFVLVIFHFSSSLWCSELAISYNVTMRYTTT